MSGKHDFAGTSVNLLALIWCGLTLGVSFIATPIKFTAPLIDFKEALDLERVTFGLFGPIELVLAVVLTIATVVTFTKRLISLLPIAALICLTMTFDENLWLRPIPDARLLSVLVGQAVAESNMHFLYIAAQVVKLPMLTLIAVKVRKEALDSAQERRIRRDPQSVRTCRPTTAKVCLTRASW